MDTSLQFSILVLVITLLVFLALREVVCWYLKINKQIKIQQAILETMLKIFEQNGGEVNWEMVKDLTGK